jgi:hypothetical protein
MIAESGKAGFRLSRILISDPESNSKLIFVFKSGETILAVGVLEVSFSFIEITRLSSDSESVSGYFLFILSWVIFPFDCWLFALSHCSPARLLDGFTPW